MNGFIPALMAALLAELGPRAMHYAEAGRREIVLWIVAIVVFAGAAAGTLIGPQLTGWADALLIAIALAFGGIGQLQRVRSAKALVPAIVAFWSGSIALLAFALATRFGAISVAFGILVGCALAAVLTRASRDGGVPMRPLRVACAAVLIVAAAVIAVGALRLV